MPQELESDSVSKMANSWDSPAYLQVTDIAGLIKGASQGEGLGNAFLSHIQAVDGMFHIVRAFDNDEVLHVDDSIDPTRDLSKFFCSLSFL